LIIFYFCFYTVILNDYFKCLKTFVIVYYYFAGQRLIFSSLSYTWSQPVVQHFWGNARYAAEFMRLWPLHRPNRWIRVLTRGPD